MAVGSYELDNARKVEREWCAKLAEEWVLFIEAKLRAGEIEQDEFRTSRATALTIAKKIRERSKPTQ